MDLWMIAIFQIQSLFPVCKDVPRIGVTFHFKFVEVLSGQFTHAKVRIGACVLEDFGIEKTVKHGRGLWKITNGESLSKASFDKCFQEKLVFKIMVPPGISLGNMEVQWIRQTDTST